MHIHTGTCSNLLDPTFELHRNDVAMIPEAEPLFAPGSYPANWRFGFIAVVGATNHVSRIDAAVAA
jgi:hypothetical protein